MKTLSLICFIAINTLVLHSVAYTQNGERSIGGKVVDEKGNPIEFATVHLSEMNESKLTNRDGGFAFDLVTAYPDSITLEVSFTGKQNKKLVLEQYNIDSFHIIVLINQSLALDEVQVSAVIKNKNSASSIIFDEEAIRQLQAFSLADVLNTLPGRKVEPPNLQSPQTITFRTSAADADAMNNSFGIALFIDGVRISNETDMQSRGLSSRGLGGSLISGGDVTYNGFDLRDIPMANIASIEIIQGVGSARYGDFTNGAILITTKAGKTPYSFNMNFNGGTSSFSLAKGIDLGRRGGALNLSVGYLNSNNDPRDKIKSYGNVNTSLKWTKRFAKMITNSFMVSAETNLDETKADPDDDAERMTYSKRRNISFSNNTTFNFTKQFLENASVILNYSTGLEDSYSRWLLNGPPQGIASKDTTGVYEGFYIPGNYLAVEHINGKPISYSINVDAQTKLLNVAGLQHQLTFGLGYNGFGNNGRGNIVSPDKPRWVGQANQNERSFNYDDSVNFTNNIAAYFQDNIRGKFFDRKFNLAMGLRLNLQNGRGNPQPRLSFNYDINNNLSLSSSYGISFKSPSLAHLYPAPTYFDVPLLSLYSGYEKSSLYLVYTEKVLAENRNLKQAVTYQFEQGVTYNSRKIGNASVFGYYKKNKNGFNTYNEFTPLDIPIYDYVVNADTTISYFPTGTYGKNWDLNRARMNNGLKSVDYGLQFSFQTKLIPLLATSFALRGGYSVSKYLGGNLTVTERPNLAAQQNGVVYVEYSRIQGVSKKSIINVTTNTHIPKIGFIVSVVADYEPLLNQRWDAENIYPMAYTLYTGEYKTLTPEQARSDELAYLRKSDADEEKLIIPSSGFWTFNMRVAKEIRKNIRLSVSAFNVLNVKAKAYKISNDNGLNGVAFYNYIPLSITIGASLQL